MSRIRTIKPEQPKDEELAALSIHARYLFAFLPCLADRKGRLEDRPRVIKLEILPWDDVDCEKLLAELSPRFVIRYENQGRRYIQIRTFEKHQRPHPKEAESEIPPPLRDGPSREKVVTSREKDMPSKVDKGKESLTMDNGKESKDCASPPSSDGVRISGILKTLMLGNNPNAKVPADTTSWAKTVDDMISRDGRSVAEIERIMRFSQQDTFWMANILSMKKFRKQFDRLYLKEKNQNGISQASSQRIVGGAKPIPGKYDDLPIG